MEVSRQRRAREAEVIRNDAALLSAARLVFAREGARASVAAIAEAAGVGVGTLYRRYPSKTALFERLLVLANEQWAAAVDRAAANPDPWDGLAALIVESVEYGQGSLGQLGRFGLTPPGLDELVIRADAAFAALVDGAHRSGGLRSEVSGTDIVLLIEQLGRSPLVEQIRELGDEDLSAEADRARRRLIAFALDGIAAGPRSELPGPPPDERMLTSRWAEEAPE